MEISVVKPDVSVRDESVETAFELFLAQRYIVNRRYQRKLIWTIDEKRAFVDSLRQSFPVPIILLAEKASQPHAPLEIIDGMQRLNAIFTFVQNHYSLDGKYFDLQASALTKKQADDRKLVQRKPILDRDESLAVMRYQLPFSVYEFNDEKTVDEVFRRINSAGRKLSKQSLRAAGATGHFATAVRTIATEVRGDTSHSDTLTLNNMGVISISNKDLDYGVDVDSMFWSRQGIITREQVRESRDEEIIAYILAYMVLDQPPERFEFLDDYFSPTSASKSRNRHAEIEREVQKRGVEPLLIDFQRTMNAFLMIFESAEKNFNQLMFAKPRDRAPRYFQVVFLAIYTLVVVENKKCASPEPAATRLNGGEKKITVAEGGSWGGGDRHTSIQAVAGMLREYFEDDKGLDPSKVHWIRKLENLLTQSRTEQSLYDFKQGFLRLSAKPEFDEGSFVKIAQTCVAIANHKKGAHGFVIVGVCDTEKDAARVKELFGVDSILVSDWPVTGINHEVAALGKTYDGFFDLITDKVFKSKISEPLKNHLLKNIFPIEYFDRTIYVFEVASQEHPSLYDNSYYARRGTEVYEVQGPALGPFVIDYAS